MFTPTEGGLPPWMTERSLSSLKGRGRKQKQAETDAMMQEHHALWTVLFQICDEVLVAPDSELPAFQERWLQFQADMDAWSYKWHGEPYAPRDDTPIKTFCTPTEGALPPWMTEGNNTTTRRKRHETRDVTPAQAYEEQLRSQLGDQADAVLAQYPLGADLTASLELVFTDGAFRCPSRALAGDFAAIAQTYVGEFTQGAQHANNDQWAYCADHVCHYDDIYSWWGTAPGGADAFAREVMGRIAAFVKTGTPGDGWSTYSGSNVFAIGGGETATCPDGFWGDKAKYNFELYSQ